MVATNSVLHLFGAIFFCIQHSESATVINWADFAEVDWARDEGCRKWITKPNAPFAPLDLDNVESMVISCVDGLLEYDDCSKKYIGIGEYGQCWCLKDKDCTTKQANRKPYQYLLRVRDRECIL